MGVNPIASEEVMWWCARQQIALTPFEHAVIDQLDGLYVHHQNKKDST